jgi:hypothetical protein
MKYANIRNTRFTATTFLDTTFDFAQGFRVSFVNCDLSACRFERSQLLEATFDRTLISNSLFISGSLQQATFKHSSLTASAFDGSQASCAKLLRCDVKSVTFLYAHLLAAEIIQTRFEDVNFSGATMRQIQLSFPSFVGQFSVNQAIVARETFEPYMFDKSTWSDGGALKGAISDDSPSAKKTGKSAKESVGACTQIDGIPGTNQELYNDAMKRLGKLVGLEDIKREFEELVAVLRINKQREQLDLSSEQTLSHYIFSGPPGTGKTTVARILGDVLKSLGYLSQGQFIETDRAGLVGRYLGETAMKTRTIVESALGGVLFIDEAYTLAPKSEQDSYSQEALATLLKLMEDKRNEFVVVAAGYGAEMRRFVESNPGLESRFSRHVVFESFSTQALIEIFAGLMTASGFVADAETSKGVSLALEMLRERGAESFGNARVVRNFFDKMTRRQSVRLLKEDGPAEKIRFSTFTFKDIPSQELLNLSPERLRAMVNDPAPPSEGQTQVFIDPKIGYKGAFFAN